MWSGGKGPRVGRPSQGGEAGKGTAEVFSADAAADPPPRVLVLDDDAGIGEAIHTALTERERYEVLTATSALEAGAIAQEHKPHVFLVDVSLPDATPTSVARFARTLPGHSGMCLIGMATGLSEAQGQALLQEGFHGYLSKPFEAFSLVTLIDSGLDVARGA